jgi:hypothetical protein
VCLEDRLQVVNDAAVLADAAPPRFEKLFRNHSSFLFVVWGALAFWADDASLCFAILKTEE